MRTVLVITALICIALALGLALFCPESPVDWNPQGVDPPDFGEGLWQAPPSVP